MVWQEDGRHESVY